MKRTLISKFSFVLTLILTVVFTSISAAQANREAAEENQSNKTQYIIKHVVVSEEALDAAFNNLMVGLKSENTGLRLSSIKRFGELKLKKAVIPLLHILNDTDEPAKFRIAAAYSLYSLNDSHANYMIKLLSSMDRNQKVSSFCAKLTKAIETGTEVTSIP